MNTLVIGGTGFIGSNLVRHLVSLGQNVKLFHRNTSSLNNLEGISVTPIVGDILNEGDLLRAMKNCNAVCNLAACGSSLKQANEIRTKINVDAAANVARSARQSNLRLIHVSSVSAIGAPNNGEIADERYHFNNNHDHYAYTKKLGEASILNEVNAGLDAVIACPGNVVGRHGMKKTQRMTFEKISRGKMNVYPPGGVCLTDVHDLVKGIVLCIERGKTGKRYILGGTNISFKEYFTEIANATNGKAPRIRIPKTLLSLLGISIEFLSGIIGREPFISRNTCRMISKNLFYSSDLAIDEIGYSITNYRQAIKNASRALEETVPASPHEKN